MLILLIDSKFIYPSAGHVVTGNLKIIPDSRIRNIVSKGPKYRFPSYIDFNKRESVERYALKEWKLSIFNIVDKRIKFYSYNTNLLPARPKSSFRHLKQGIIFQPLNRSILRPSVY